MTLAITDALRDEVRLQNATTSGQVKEVIIEKMVDIYEKGEDNFICIEESGRSSNCINVCGREWGW